MSALAKCSEYQELISASLDGALTPEEQEKLDAHLSECPDCRTMWEQLSALEPELMELSEPSEGFADRVLAAAGSSPICGTQAARLPVRPPRPQERRKSTALQPERTTPLLCLIRTRNGR